MNVRTSGVAFTGECELQLPGCTAAGHKSPITAVFPESKGRQVNVCRTCLQSMVRSGDWEVPGARVSQYADIAVFDDKQRLQVVIETQKAPTELGESIDDWAYRVHHNMLAYKAVPFSTFFWLIATNGQFRLWKHQGSASTLALPDYRGSIETQISGFLSPQLNSGSSTKRLTNAVLEWIAFIKQDDYGDKAPLWLTESGLLSVLLSGRVQTEFAQ